MVVCWCGLCGGVCGLCGGVCGGVVWCVWYDVVSVGYPVIS